MRGPIDIAIEEARGRVFEELKGKRCEDVLKTRCHESFKALSDKADRCNNVAMLHNIRVEADALKVRLLNEIVEKEKELSANVGPGSGTTTETKKKKVISIKSISTATTWQIETAEDVDAYLNALRSKLIESLEDNTIINIEF